MDLCKCNQTIQGKNNFPEMLQFFDAFNKESALTTETTKPPAPPNIDDTPIMDFFPQNQNTISDIYYVPSYDTLPFIETIKTEKIGGEKMINGGVNETINDSNVERLNKNLNVVNSIYTNEITPIADHNEPVSICSDLTDFKKKSQATLIKKECCDQNTKIPNSNQLKISDFIPLPSQPKNNFICGHCDRKYKTKKIMDAHIKKKHASLIHKEKILVQINSLKVKCSLKSIVEQELEKVLLINSSTLPYSNPPRQTFDYFLADQFINYCKTYNLDNGMFANAFKELQFIQTVYNGYFTQTPSQSYSIQTNKAGIRKLLKDDGESTDPLKVSLQEFILSSIQ